MKTIIEPFRVKSVEPIRMTTRPQRKEFIKQAHFNPFLLKAEDVLIDLLTDSGTSAMSSAQWAGIMLGDESYAGARSFYHFHDQVLELTGYTHIIPAHQGRAAERILFGAACNGSGMVVPNNSHFDTTRANVEHNGTIALDIPCKEAKVLESDFPFKGNMDLEALEICIKEYGADKIPMVMITITNNTGGGQPVSLANIRAVAKISHAHNIPVYLDAARFAENAYFIKIREPGQGERAVKDIAQEMFRLVDGCTMSAKKDALVNIGGFVATNDGDLAEQMRNDLILTEGFPTYGGLAGRDLEAIAIGLREILDEDYLHYRIASTQYVGDHLAKLGVPVMQPIGGHAIYIDARKFLSHIDPLDFPGQALCIALYEVGGIRGVEVGQVMFGRLNKDGTEELAPKDLVRLAIPRRVYTQSHMDYVIEVFEELLKERDAIKGVKLSYQAPALRHFTAKFAPL